jgi:acyl dehydratase
MAMTTDMWDPTVTVGAEFVACVVEDLGRAHIAQYAGASGDFNSVHVDEVFATSEAGRESVIAHGMLTMGLTATFLTSIVGHGTLRSFGGRFLAAVQPGDTLDCLATITDVSQDGGRKRVSLHIETRTSAGSVVFVGDAVAAESESGVSSR